MTRFGLRAFAPASAVGISVVATALGGTVAQAAVASTSARPRVALVLSGGGALGLAHVGAIRELERLGIRPDIVVGTSMGAVVGGLYASGLDGAALERVVHTVDWKAVLNPRPDRDRLTFRQKAQQADFPVRTSLALKNGALQLPGGLISDRVLLQELRRFAGVGGVSARFDDLAIPFRAVATDIETGGVVVLDRGDLSMAMRASMAVPGVFAPVAIDGRLLVDGGMAANVPIAVARELGADIVIAVTFRSDLLKQKDIVSALDVLGQTVSLLIIANERASLATLASTDILVEIDTRGFSTSDFTRGAELIEVGRKGIEPQAERLAALAAARGRATYVQPAPAIAPMLDYVRIDNSSRLDDAVVARKLDGLIGRAATPAEINTALDGVYALGPFERVDFAVETVGDRTGLLVRAEDSVPEAGRIRLGLTVSNNFSDDSDYAVSFDYRTAALDHFGSELQVQATVGDRNILSAEYFKLLEPRQRWFAAGRIDLQNRKVDLYEEGGFKRAEYQLSYGLAALDIGYQFGSFAELRIGLERGGGRAKLATGVAEPSEIDIRIGRLAARAGLDTLDDPFFPRRGTRGTARWTRGFRELGDRSDFQTVAGSGLVALSADRHTAILSVSGGSNISGTTPVESMFRLGGLFNFSGYRQDELTGEAFGIGRAVYRYTLTDTAKKLFGATLYLGASIEAGNVWARREDAGFADLRYAGSIYVAADTGLGPIFLAYGRATGGRQSVYLFIGRPF